MIIDCHTHLAAASTLPDPFFEGWGDNIKRLLPPEVPERHKAKIAARFRLDRPDPTGDLHVAEMTAAGIDLSVSLVIDFGLAFPEHSPPLEDLYAQHRAVAARHPGRFAVFAGVDPRRGRAGLELFERSLTEWGFKGLKLYPPCGFSPSDPALDPFYDLCAQHGVPVLTHTGPTTPRLPFTHTRPTDVEAAAFRWPNVDFVLAHGAVVHGEDAALLAEFRPNVYVDMAGFQLASRRGELVAVLALYKRRGLLRKLLLGTDHPIHRQYGSLASWVEQLRTQASSLDSPLTSAELSWVLGENARQLLRIP